MEGHPYNCCKMPFTSEDYLPSYAELEVEEIDMTAAPLRAGAHHFGKYCDTQCKVSAEPVTL